MPGGAVFSNLDYSFTAEHEDGTATVEDPTPGGGGPILREQLAILKRFVEGFDLVHLQETKAFIAAIEPREFRREIQAMADRGSGSLAIYVPKGPRVRLGLDLPPQSYRIEWIDPRDGGTLKVDELDARGGVVPGASVQLARRRGLLEAPRAARVSRHHSGGDRLAGVSRGHRRADHPPQAGAMRSQGENSPVGFRNEPQAGFRGFCVTLFVAGAT